MPAGKEQGLRSSLGPGKNPETPRARPGLGPWPIQVSGWTEATTLQLTRPSDLPWLVVTRVPTVPSYNSNDHPRRPSWGRFPTLHPCALETCLMRPTFYESPELGLGLFVSLPRPRQQWSQQQWHCPGLKRDENPHPSLVAPLQPMRKAREDRMVKRAPRGRQWEFGTSMVWTLLQTRNLLLGRRK